MVTNIKMQMLVLGSILTPKILLALMLALWCSHSSVWAQDDSKNYPGTIQLINKNLDDFKVWYKPNREPQIGLPDGSAAALNSTSLNIPASGQNFLTDFKNLQTDWEEISNATDIEQIRQLLEPFTLKVEALRQQAEAFSRMVISSNNELIGFTAAVRVNRDNAQKKHDQAKQLYNQSTDRYLEIKSKAIRIPTDLSGDIQMTEDPNYPFTEAEKSEMAGLAISSIQYENDMGQYGYFVAENNRLLPTLDGLLNGFKDCLNELNWAITKLEAAQHDAQKAIETEDEGAFNIYHKNVALAMDQLFSLL